LIFLTLDIYAQELESSISKIEGNKAYLKPQLIQVAKNGIFICISDQLISINHLNLDSKVFISVGISLQAILVHSVLLVEFPSLEDFVGIRIAQAKVNEHNCFMSGPFSLCESWCEPPY